MSTSSAPEYEPDPRPAGAARRVSVFGRNGADGRLERGTAEVRWQDAQPTQAVSAEMNLGDDAPTTALPTSYEPADADPAPTAALPTSVATTRGAAPPPRPASVPDPGPVPLSGPTAPAPMRLPAPPVRRRTAATPLGTVMVLLASALLGWGIYTLLTSLNVFNLLQGDHSLINTTAATAFAIGAVLAFIAFIVAIVAVVRARPKTAAALLVLASLVLPTAATVAGAYYGATALKEQTTAQAWAYADAVDVEQIDALMTWIETMGATVPGKDEVLDILRAAKGEG
ncbi:hypothetical protein [Actinomyces sp.]|uniref:hypothetical protein n=1 Tax=Actinomyces sp. TaxID=29317 RepID=UPI0026DC8298|nr:hypothetical protein [Actinomyces sp.]MDO4899978.1 hypothetical protein [Actinomyces sp.]